MPCDVTDIPARAASTLHEPHNGTAEARRSPSPWRTLLCLLLLSLALLTLAFQWPRSEAIDIGSGDDAPYLQGFHFAEQQGQDTFRWTGPEAVVTWRGLSRRAWSLTLRAAGPRPEGSPTLKLRVNGAPLGDIELGWGMQEFHIPIAAEHIGPLGRLKLEMATEPFTSPPDERQLGAMVDAIRLEPGGVGLAVPPLGTLAGLLLAVVGSHSIARRLGARRRPALLVGLAAAAALAAGVVIVRPLLVLYLPWLLLGLAALWAFGPRARVAPWWEWIAFGAVAGSLYLFIQRAVDFYHTGLPPGDFSIYFAAARNLASGLPLYDFAAAREMPNGPVYKYPPFFAVLLAPTTALPAEVVAALWYMLNLGLLLFIFFCLWRKMNGSREAPPPYFYLLALGFLGFGPAWESLIRGQLDLIILAGAVAALLLLRSRRTEALSGAILALVTMLKLYPGLIVVYLAWRRRWRAVAGFVAASIVLIIVSGLAVGWPTLFRYVAEILTVQTAAVPWPENQGLDGFLSRLVIPPQATTWYTTIPFPAWARLTLYGLDLVVLAAAVWGLWGGRWPSERRFELGYASVMTLIVLMWPTSWIHYQTLLLLPYALLLLHLLRAKQVPWMSILLLTVSFLLVSRGNEYTVLKPAFEAGWARLAQSYKLYGVLILFGLSLHAGRQMLTESRPVATRASGQMVSKPLH